MLFNNGQSPTKNKAWKQLQIVLWPFCPCESKVLENRVRMHACYESEKQCSSARSRPWPMQLMLCIPGDCHGFKGLSASTWLLPRPEGFLLWDLWLQGVIDRHPHSNARPINRYGKNKHSYIKGSKLFMSLHECFGWAELLFGRL